MHLFNQKVIVELQYDTLFFFNDTATTEIYTLSLHDALPICAACGNRFARRNSSKPSPGAWRMRTRAQVWRLRADRKSTRLNSSHSQISYAVFCLKKKNKCETISHDLPSIVCCPSRLPSQDER